VDVPNYRTHTLPIVSARLHSTMVVSVTFQKVPKRGGEEGGTAR